MCKHVSEKNNEKKKAKDFTSHVNRNKTLINKKKKNILLSSSMWNIFSLYCVIDEISWSRVTFEAGTILSLLNCVVVVFKRMSYFFYIYNKKNKQTM